MPVLRASSMFLRIFTRRRMLISKSFRSVWTFPFSSSFCRAGNTKTLFTSVFSLRRTDVEGVLDTPYSPDIPESASPFQLHQELYKLEADVQKMGRISQADVRKVFTMMKEKGNVKGNEGLILLRSCGSFIPEMPAEFRSKLVEDIWNTLPKLNCSFNVSHYNALLKIHLENKFNVNPFQFLDSMKQQKVEPNRVTYQRLLGQCCQDGDIDGAKTILELMKSKNLSVDEQIYNYLILGHARANNMKGARQILDIMRSYEIIPSSATYTALACGYAIIGDVDNVLLVLQESEDNDFRLKHKDILHVIYTLIINHHEDLVEKILPKLRFETGYNNECLKVVLELVNQGHHQSAFTLLNTMPKGHITDITSVSYELLFIQQIVRQGLPLKVVVEYCSKLQEKELQELALLKATESSLLLQKPEDAAFLLKELHSKGFKLRTHFFWPVIMCHKGNENNIYDTLKLMASLNCPADFNTFINSVFPIISLVDLNTVVLRLRNVGYQVTDIINPLSVFLVQKGDVQSASELLRRYPVNSMIASMASNCLALGCVKSRDTNSTIEILHHCQQHPLITTNTKIEESDTFGKFIFDLVRTNGCDVPLLESFLECLKQKNFKMSTSAWKIISQNLGDLSSPGISIMLKSLVSSEVPPLNEELESEAKPKLPATMSVDELETRLVEKKSKGERTIEVLHKLLMLHVKNRDLDQVKETISELDEAGYIYRGNAYAVLIDIFCYHGDLERAMRYKHLLDKEFPRFRLDLFKIIDLATLLARNKKYQDAQNMIVSYHSAFGSGNNKFNSSRNIFKLLESFASSEDVGHARIIFEMLESFRYCLPSNVVLGPLVKVHLTRNDVPGAVNEFLRIVKSYKKTPWLMELLKVLVQVEDIETLKKVKEAAATVHGEANSVLDLARAFSECGKLQEASKIIQSSGAKFHESRMNILCENYVERNQVLELESFLKVTKNLVGINRDYMYYQLLRTYVTADNVEKALNVWNMMQEEDVLPSKRTMHLLGTFLQKKNHPVPFIVPQESSTQRVSRSRLDSSVKDTSSIIDAKLKANNLSEAVKLADELFSVGLYPSPKVVQKLALKLSGVHQVKNLMKLQRSIPQELVLKIPFSDYIIGCFQNEKCVEEFLSVLETEMFKLKDKLPLEEILGLLCVKPQVQDRVEKLADAYYVEGVSDLRKVLWISYMKRKMFHEADRIFQITPEMQSHLYLLALTKHIEQSNDVEISQKLLDVVRNTNLSSQLKGMVYSSHINVLLSVRNLEEALKVVSESRRIIDLEDLNRNVLVRLKEHLVLARMPVPFQIPKFADSSRNRYYGKL